MSSTRRLVVNADDFGLSPGVNAGIAQAHRWGIVTSASLMVWQPAAAHAAALAALKVDLACARLQLCLELLALPQGFDPPEDHAGDWAGRAARLTAELAV